jgi:hypothetical protein
MNKFSLCLGIGLMLMIHVACADTGKNDESMEDADTKDHAPSETVLNSWSKYVEVH